MDIAEATAALGQALRHDATFENDPERLARALHDVLPGDDTTVRLLVCAVSAGVPAMLDGTRDREAAALLSDGWGMRDELARQVVWCWQAATGRSERPGTSKEIDELAAPGRPVAVALGEVDGRRVAVLATEDGVFAAVIDDGPTVWRRVSAVAARAVALADSRLLWTGPSGIRGCRLATLQGMLEVTDERPVAVAPGGPAFAAVCTEAGRVDVLWGADGARIGHAIVRDLPSGPPFAVPAAPGRLRLLTAVRGIGVVWLAALTEDGTAAVARWSLANDRIGRWEILATPEPLVSFAVAELDKPRVLAFTASGKLMTCAAAPGMVWRPVEAPAGVPGAVAFTGRALLVSAGEKTWLAPVGVDGWGAPSLGKLRTV